MSSISRGAVDEGQRVGDRLLHPCHSGPSSDADASCLCYSQQSTQTPRLLVLPLLCPFSRSLMHHPAHWLLRIPSPDVICQPGSLSLLPVAPANCGLNLSAAFCCCYCSVVFLLLQRQLSAFSLFSLFPPPKCAGSDFS